MEDFDAVFEKIDRLVAKASPMENSEKKREVIEEAFGKACFFFNRMMRQIDRYIRDTLENAELGDEEKGLPLGDLIQTNAALKPFASFEILKETFVPSLSELLAKQGRSTKQDIDKSVAKIAREISNLFSQMLREPAGLAQLKEKFEGLQRLFCDGPPGGLGVGPITKGPPPVGPGSWLDSACTYLQTLLAVGQIFAHTQTADLPKQPDRIPVPLPAPLLAMLRLRLLALFAMAAFATKRNLGGEIPPKKTPGGFEGGTPKETIKDRMGELAVAGHASEPEYYPERVKTA